MLVATGITKAVLVLLVKVAPGMAIQLVPL